VAVVIELRERNFGEEFGEVDKPQLVNDLACFVSYHKEFEFSPKRNGKPWKTY
jgi:hypothetical protein